MVTLKIHYKEVGYFYGKDLTIAREQLGLSQKEFAEKCKWSQALQSRLELPGMIHRLDLNKRELFNKLGIRLL